MKHTYLLLCFFISIIQIVKIVRGENLPETSVKKDKQIGPEYDASKYSLLDDVTDLNDLSEEEKQEYIRFQKNLKIISKDVLEKTSPVDNLDLSSRISNPKIEKSEISLHLKAKTSILEEVKTSEKKDGVTLENTKTNIEEQKEIESTTLSIEKNVMDIEPIELESEMTEKENRNEENLEATNVETTSLKLKKDTTNNNEKFEFENSEAQVKPNEKTEKKVFETVIGINSTHHSFGSIETSKKTETTENPQLENNPKKIESSIIESSLVKEDSTMDTIKEQKLTPDSEIVLRTPDILKSSDSERSEMEGEKSTTISFINNQNFKNSFESEEYFIKDSVVEEVKVTTTVSTTHLIENDDLYNYFVKNETEMESRVNQQSENEKDLSKNMNFTNESSETLIKKPSHHSVEILNEDHHLSTPNESLNNIGEIEERISITTSISHEENSKYCANFEPIKELLNQHIEQFFKPIISLLPENFQLILLDETNIAGLNKAACILVIFVISMMLGAWYTYLNKQQKDQQLQAIRLNEKILIIENSLKKMNFEKQTFESEYTVLEVKYSDLQELLTEKDEKLSKSEELVNQLTQKNNLNKKEIEKLISNEAKLTNDLNALEISNSNLEQKRQSEFNELESLINSIKNENETKVEDLNNKLFESERKLQLNNQQFSQLDLKIDSLQKNEIRNIKLLTEKEILVQMLQNSLLQFNKKDIVISTELTDESIVLVNNNMQPQILDSLIKIAEFQMEIKCLEDALTNERSQLKIKTAQLNDLEERFTERQTLTVKLEERQKDLLKLSKDQEMQIKLLNELREKDTKQHLKALSDLDLQLKKKSNDADKISHFLDQLRVKQERIQELESQFARIERQANQERQQFEKQAHENWLQARKIEKELKEAKIEIATLTERCSELEISNKNFNENYILMRQTLPGKQTIAQNNASIMSQANYIYQQQQISSASQFIHKSNESLSPTTNKFDNTVEPNDKQVDQPLQLETLIDKQRKNSSSSPSISSTSGVIHQQIPPIHPYMIRPSAASPYRLPFPIPATAPYQQQRQLNDSTDGSTSNPNQVNGSGMMPPIALYPGLYSQHIPPPQFRINPILFQQQQQYLQQQYQLFQQSKSATSSQQASPDSSKNNYDESVNLAISAEEFRNSN